MDKVKRFLGIKKDKKGTPAAGGGAPQPAPLAVNMEDLAGSKKASHGVGGSESSHKAHGGHHHHHHHHAHDAFQSKSASKGVGSSSSMIANADLGSMGSMAASDIVGVHAEPSRTNATDDAWRQEAQIPSAKPAKRSEVAAKGGFVNPDGTRLTKDDVNMMKVMVTQVLESYIKLINSIYSESGIAQDKSWKDNSFYKSFCKQYFDENHKLLVSEDKINKADLVQIRGWEKIMADAAIDEVEKPKMLSELQGRLSRLSGEMDAIQKGKKPVSASAFLESYMNQPIHYTGKETRRTGELFKKVVNTQKVSDFQATLNAVSAEFDAHKDEELEGIGDIKKYNPKKSEKLLGGRTQRSQTLSNELETLFGANASFRVAINEDDFIKKQNKGEPFGDKDGGKLMNLVASNNDVANRVLTIIKKNKLTGSARSVENFSKAAAIASKHAQKLKSKSKITFSDLMHAYMDLNAGIGDLATRRRESDDGKMKAAWAGTSSGKIVGPTGETISADLFLMFNFAANTMNEIKAIQKKQPNVAKSRAIKLAGIMNSMTVSAHTFVNGNGRTCRLLSDVILEATELPPASVNETMTSVGGLFGELYANDGQKADGQKDFDLSTRGYLAGVKESDRLLQSK